MSETPVMLPLTWDAAADRGYEYGVSKVVLYPKNTTTGDYDSAVAWNGITNITDSPSGADATKFWADNIQYANMRAAEEYAASAEAYMFPDEFAKCDGSDQPVPGLSIGQQQRTPFGLCWRTELGNAQVGDTAGYKLHIAYGLTASPSEKTHDTVNDSPDAVTFSWDFEGTPVEVTGHKPTCKIELNSLKIPEEKMTAIENMLYGTTTSAAYLPLPDTIQSILTDEEDDEDEDGNI